MSIVEQQQRQQHPESPVTMARTIVQSLMREQASDNDIDNQVECALHDISNQHATTMMMMMIPPRAAAVAGVPYCGGPRKSNNNVDNNNHHNHNTNSKSNVDHNHNNNVDEQSKDDDDSQGTDLCSSSDDDDQESCNFRIHRLTSKESMFSMGSTPSFTLLCSSSDDVSSLGDNDNDEDQSFEYIEFIDDQEEYQKSTELVNDLSNIQLQFTKVVRVSSSDSGVHDADDEVSVLGTDDDDDHANRLRRRQHRRRRSTIDIKTKTAPVSEPAAPRLVVDDFDFATAKSYLANLALGCAQPGESTTTRPLTERGGKELPTRVESCTSMDSEYTEIEVAATSKSYDYVESTMPLGGGGGVRKRLGSYGSMDTEYTEVEVATTKSYDYVESTRPLGGGGGGIRKRLGSYASMDSEYTEVEVATPERRRPLKGGGGVPKRLGSYASMDSEYTEIEYIETDDDEMMEEEIVEEEEVEEEEEQQALEETLAIDKTEVLEEIQVAEDMEDPTL